MPRLVRIALLLLALLPLSGCHTPPPPVRPPVPPPVILTDWPAPAPLAPQTAAATAAPQADAPVPPPPTGEAVVVIPALPVAPGAASPAAAAAPAAPANPTDSPLLAQQRDACAREGGRLSTLPSGLVSCIRQTRDAGRSCTGAADCDGVCLARTGTCAPIAPLFGCHEVQLAPGSRVTQCLD